MGRKAPFSGKQKKEQLQQRRERKRQAPGSRYDEAAFDSAMDGGVSPEGQPSPPVVGSSTSRLHAEEATLSADKGGIRSRFKADSTRETRARKRLSYLPLVDRRNDPAIPFGEWFKMAYSGTYIDHNAEDERCVSGDAAASPDAATSDEPLGAEGAAQLCGTTGGGGVRKAVYQWKDVPLCLALPEPVDGFIGVRRKLSKPEVAALKADEEAQFAAWLTMVEREAANVEAGGINQYERNIDVWKQLWFTVDHSDVVMIIVDARYPAFHLPLSLVRFVVIEQRRKAVVVLNKSDLLPAAVLQHWKDFLRKWTTAFLEKEGVENPHAAFAIVEMCSMPEAFDQDMTEEARFGVRRRKMTTKPGKQPDYRQLASELEDMGLSPAASDAEDDPYGTDSDDLARVDNFKGRRKAYRDDMEVARRAKERAERILTVSHAIDTLLRTCHTLAGKGTEPIRSRATTPSSTPRLSPAAAPAPVPPMGSLGSSSLGTSPLPPPDPRVLDKQRVNPADKNIHGPSVAHTLCIGLVGHPNVGKSSLINAIRGAKLVSVSATPGHTKHMQTVNLPKDNCVLYDCPGLCFPLLGVPKPLQTILGTQQIAQTRDPASGIAFLARHLPIERMYGLRKVYDEDENWSAHELCEAFATKRGYVIHGKGGGTPDVHRAAIEILQEAFAGRLVLFFLPPPDERIDQLVRMCDRHIDVPRVPSSVNLDALAGPLDSDEEEPEDDDADELTGSRSTCAGGEDDAADRDADDATSSESPSLST